MWRLNLMLVVALATVLGACRDNARDAGDQPPSLEKEASTLRSFTLPERGADQTFDLLKDALEFGPRDDRGNVIQPVARVVRGPGNEMIVLGPQRIQDGVQSLLGQLSAAKMPAEKPTKTIEVTYWLVRGLRADATEVPADLESASKALEAVVTDHGPLRFQLVERAFIRAVAGSDGEAKGRYLRLQQQLDVRDDGQIVGWVRFGALSGELDTRVALGDGQLLVVGETGSGSDAFPELGLESGTTPAALFYIVRARAL